jgi:hypothetical protein
MTRAKKLEIGSGANPTEGYVHLDINPNAPHVEFVGDIRAIFIPQDYTIEKYPTLKALKPSHMAEELLIFDEIRAYHVVEHIHWYNQPVMWQWMYSLLNYNSILDIETPNLEWMIKTYVKNKEKSTFWKFLSFSTGQKLKFPLTDHPDITQNTDYNLSRWLCFKLFSGGSYDAQNGFHDYHLGLYDKTRITHELTQCGFQPQVTIDNKHGTLKIKAIKIKNIKIKDYFDMQVMPV